MFKRIYYFLDHQQKDFAQSVNGTKVLSVIRKTAI